MNNQTEILEVLRQVKVNIPLLDMIKKVPTYAKFLKDLCTIKRGLNEKKKAFSECHHTVQDFSEVKRSRVSYHISEHQRNLCGVGITRFEGQCQLVTLLNL